MASSRPASAVARPTPASVPAGRGGLRLGGLVFASGAVALVYEVLWQRQFALVLGSGGPSVAAVLAAFFAGMGAGSLVLGRGAKRWRRPLRVYAVLELAIGVGALVVVLAMKGFEAVYPWLHEQLAGNPGVFTAVKAALAFVVLALPTFCLGGTLPVLGRMVDGGRRQLGIHAGWLYAANTAGAAAGALAVPFVLLPGLGAPGTLAAAMGGNAFVAFAAWWLDGRQPDASLVEAESDPRAGKLPPRSPRGPYLWLSAISGCSILALQVLWNRAFALVHENSLHAFAIIAAVFILALAVGAQLARMFLRRSVAPRRLLALAWWVGGTWGALSPWIFVKLTGGLAYLPVAGGVERHAFHLVGLALAVVAGPATLLGMGLPALMEAVGRESREDFGGLLGRLLAANIAGAVAGALAAGFVLPGGLGLWRSVLVAAGMLAVAGAWQFGAVRARGALLIGTGLAVWLAGSGELPRVRVAEKQGERVVAVAEGVHGVVAVVERPNSRRLKLNNHYVLGGTASAGDERMQAHVPLLLHPAPRRVAVLGLGTGITAGGALFHPLEQLVAVELVPEVAAAAREHFAAANAGLCADARTRLVIEDARNYLRGSRAQFDVIVGDLVVPWRPGEGALFTREHFAAARARLAPGGLFCQWLPLFQLGETELTIVLRTFLAVFPEAMVWRGDFSPDEPAVALVGAAAPYELKPEVIERRLRELRPDPLNPQLAEPLAFWMHLAGRLRPEDLPPGETRVHRESAPWLELLGPAAPGGGRRAQAWLGEVRRRSAGAIAEWGERATAGAMAGERLLEFTLLLAEQNEAGARAAHAELRRLLPARVFEFLFPEPPAGARP